MASRKEEKERLRRERLEREQAEARAAARRKRIGLVTAGVLVLAALGAGVAIALSGGGGGGDGGGGGGGGFGPEVDVPERRITDINDAAKAAGCRLEEPKDEGRDHTSESVDYKSNPPTSGPHDPSPAGDGAYSEAPPTEQLVHSLEHGRIIFQWGPRAPARVRGALKAVYDEDAAIVLLAPNATRMPYEVAATAWGRLLACPRYNDRVPDALRAFRDEFRLEGPEFVPTPE